MFREVCSNVEFCLIGRGLEQCNLTASRINFTPSSQSTFFVYFHLIECHRRAILQTTKSLCPFRKIHVLLYKIYAAFFH